MLTIVLLCNAISSPSFSVLTTVTSAHRNSYRRQSERSSHPLALRIHTLTGGRVHLPMNTRLNVAPRDSQVTTSSLHMWPLVRVRSCMQGG